MKFISQIFKDTGSIMTVNGDNSRMIRYSLQDIGVGMQAEIYSGDLSVTFDLESDEGKRVKEFADKALTTGEYINLTVPYEVQLVNRSKLIYATLETDYKGIDKMVITYLSGNVERIESGQNPRDDKMINYFKNIATKEGFLKLSDKYGTVNTFVNMRAVKDVSISGEVVMFSFDGRNINVQVANEEAVESAKDFMNKYPL